MTTLLESMELLFIYLFFSLGRFFFLNHPYLIMLSKRRPMIAHCNGSLRIGDYYMVQLISSYQEKKIALDQWIFIRKFSSSILNMHPTY